MKKLQFSELMNLLLVLVIIILIYQIPNKATNNAPEKKQVVKAPSSKKKLTQLADTTFQLASPSYESSVSVETTMLHRRSQRDYTLDAISNQQLSQVLWAAYGITEIMDEPAFLRGGLKTAPSAGARYPLDIYVLVGNVDGLKKGLYKFIPQGHRLKPVLNKDLREALCDVAFEQPMIQEAPAVLLYTAVFERCTSKYGERGRERYVCMDLGHSAENVYLQVQSLGLGTCAIGAFDDEGVKKVIQLSEEEEPLYIMPIGYYTESE